MAAAPGDEGVPNVARIYDYLLGGSHNLAVDRERGDLFIATRPSIVATVRANRAFLRHAVDRACDRGIDQFLDLGSGIPTAGNVHEVARRRSGTARVAYVDDEPVAVAHSAAILDGLDGVGIVDGDYREPEAVLRAAGVAGLLDLARPVALLALTALHFVWDADGPGDVLRRYRTALAPGSLLALTHASDDYPDDPDFVLAHRAVREQYDSTSHPIQLRSREEIRAIMTVAGFTPDEDGLVEIGHWAAPAHDGPLGGYAAISGPVP